MNTPTKQPANETLIISAQQAMVLLEIDEMVEDDAVSVSRALNMNVGRVVQIARDLHKKGLVIVKRVSGELYLRLTKKGKRLMGSLWPAQAYS
jgi:DNA-binding MarR family transcriptional regulator